MRAWVQVTVMTVVALLMIAAGIVISATAHASVSTPGDRALNWAETHAAGCWYTWGGAGPCSHGWDCSGLVMAGYAATGITLPHNTVAMVRSGHLVRTWHPVRGDVAVWGSPSAPYHMEFVTAWPHSTFGAHHTGLRISWRSYGPGYAPSAFYQVK